MINALPGCSILVPTLIDSHEAVLDFVENENDESKIVSVIDLHIYLANWFRELINGFASQDAVLYRQKVLTRLSHLIELEAQIRLLLESAPEGYVPPVCRIVPTTSTNGRIPTNKKATTAGGGQPSTSRNSKNQTFTDSEPTLLDTTTRTHEVSTTHVSDHLKKLSTRKDKSSSDIYALDYTNKDYLRSMDADIMHLLRENFVVRYPLPAELRGFSIGLLEVKFILHDLVIKVESVTDGVKAVSAELKNNSDYAQKFMNELITSLPKVLIITEQLTEYITKGCTNVEMLYSDEMNLVKICFGLVLQLLVGLLRWPKFKDNVPMLVKCLRLINAKSIFEPTQESTLPEEAMLAIKKVMLYDKHVLDLMSAVFLFNIVKLLAVFAGSTEETNEIVTSICVNYLSKPWIHYDGTLEKGARCNVLLNELLKGLFKGANMVTIKKFVKIVVKDIKLVTKKDSNLKKFPLFNKYNVLLFFYFTSKLI